MPGEVQSPDLGQYIPQIEQKDPLNDRSRSLADRVDLLEKKLNIHDGRRIGENVRAGFFKIRNLEHHWNGKDPELKRAYDAVLGKYEGLKSREFQSQQEYFDATKDLLHDIQELRTKKGKPLKEVVIDWGMLEWIIAIYDWGKDAIKTITNEVLKLAKLALSDNEKKAFMEGIARLFMMEPKECFKNILGLLKEHWHGIYRDFLAIYNNSTGDWMRVEGVNLVTKEGIPIIIAMIWPGKFLRAIKAERFLGEKIVAILEKAFEASKIEQQASNTLESTVGKVASERATEATASRITRREVVGEMIGSSRNLVDHTYQIRWLLWKDSLKNIQIFKQDLAIEYILAKPERFEKALATIDELCAFLLEKKSLIHNDIDKRTAILIEAEAIKDELLNLAKNPKVRWADKIKLKMKIGKVLKPTYSEIFLDGR